MGDLTTHVLNVAYGKPAAGMRIELFAIGPGDQPSLLKTATTNAEGRTEAPLLAGAAMKIGRYELRFHVADFYRAFGAPLTDPPFLDKVPVRFAIANAGEHYHVPLLISPWAYSTYRGG
jgi:5-hydroxyisourate hydrolase